VSDGHIVTYRPAGTAPHGIQIHAAYVSMTPDGDVIIASSRERTELLRVSDGARVMLRAFVDEREQIQWLAETAEGVFSASPAIAASRAYRSGSLFDGRLLTPGEVRRRYERTNLIADLMAGRAVTPLP
jgi:hypothetical protein